MIVWEPIVDQLKEPFLLYSIILSISTAAFTYITLKVLKIQNSKLKSIFYMIPLFIPLAVYMIFPPRCFIGVFSIGHLSVASTYHEVVIIQYIKIISIVGLLCLAGLIFGIALLPVLYIFSNRIVCRFHGVIEITPDDKPTLFQMVDKIANSVGISAPHIGITENLEPNAFTIGYGKRVMIVFSSGLLDMLDSAELEAVIAHEMAHIKNHDFHFMALMSALKVISFFNPIVYLLSSAITREREILADDTGSRLVEQPERLGLALLKIWDAPKGFSQGFLTRFVSGFFIVSEIGRLKTLFAIHPPLERRLNNIAEREFWRNVSRDRPKAVLACFMITVMIISVCYPLFQTYFFVERRGGISVTATGTKYGAFIHRPYKLAPVQGMVGGFPIGSSFLQNINQTSVMIFAQGDQNQLSSPTNENTILTVTGLPPG